MDSQELGIVTLLRSALKDEALVLPVDFNWRDATDILYKHYLVAMALRGATRCGVPRTEPAIRNLTAQFCREVAKSRQQTKMLHAIYAVFQERGIAYMPVKGAILRDLYPQRELRAMGDADILIQKKQYPVVQDIMLSFGMQKEVESDHEYIWFNSELKVELHKHLIPSYNKDYYAYYGDGWQLAQKDEHSSAHSLSPEDHFIFLLVHFAKHYRDGMISAKNICDFWVYRKAFPKMDDAYLSAELQKLKLLDFYHNILDLLNTWFEGAPPTEAVEILTKTTFQGGIYMPEDSAMAVSVIKLKRENVSLSGSKFRMLLRMLAPPASTLSRRYPILIKAPILLPFFWVKRGFDLLFLDPLRRKRGIARSQKLMHMTDGRITDYENSLRAVGLDFTLPE